MNSSVCCFHLFIFNWHLGLEEWYLGAFSKRDPVCIDGVFPGEGPIPTVECGVTMPVGNVKKCVTFLGLLLSLFFSSFVPAFAAVEEYPLFTTLEGFSFNPKASTSEKFAKYGFKTGEKGNEKTTVEGKFYHLEYKLKKGVEAPGNLMVLRNFIQAVTGSGGEVLRETTNDATLRIVQGDREIWVRIATLSSGSAYDLYVIEKGAMKQEVAVNPILDAMDSAGRATVHINFDTNSSNMKADAAPVIADILAMLNQRPGLRLSIEGHTDGDGTTEKNQKLSEERAQAVMTALTRQGIAPSRLVTKGYGMSKPVAENTTEQGKAQNRRVELVKVD